MGGGKPKKPISARDKRRKATASVRKKSKEERVIAFHDVTDTLIKRASRTVKDMDVVTPYTLASALSIKLSLARRVMRALAESGELKIIERSRSLIIAVPAKK